MNLEHVMLRNKFQFYLQGFIILDDIEKEREREKIINLHFSLTQNYKLHKAFKLIIARYLSIIAIKH